MESRLNQVTPLDDKDLGRLGALLDALPAPLEPLDESALDGFLCGVLLQPRPGRIHSIYPVPLPARREQGMKHEAGFRALKDEILGHIRISSGMSTDLELLEKLNAQETSL